MTKRIACAHLFPVTGKRDSSNTKHQCKRDSPALDCDDFSPDDSLNFDPFDGPTEKFDEALSLFLVEGQSYRASRTLHLALSQNLLVSLLILDIILMEEIEEWRSPSFRTSDDFCDRAIRYARQQKHLWKSTPGALRWLCATILGQTMREH